MLILILLSLVASSLCATDLNCNFNGNDCGFVQRTDDDFDWTMMSGMTPTYGTGPWTDADGWGNYMYTDARGKTAGSKAKLESVVISFSGVTKCLSFYYHMNGYDMGNLAVYLGNRLIWSMAGNQRDLWHQASFTVPVTTGSHKIMFVGTIGSGILSDMAIDDIILKDCNAPLPPAPQTPPPPTGTIQPGITTLPPVPPTQSPQPGSCGIRPSTRIVGGKDANHGDWPWQAMLQSSSGSQFCGGALVHPQWVVTASHCLDRKVPSQVRVRMGAHKRTSSVGTEQDFGVSRIILHSSYQSPKSYSNDIALIKLDRPALLDKYTNLVCLPESIPDVTAGSTCWITGWGTLSSGGSQPDTLQQASVPIVKQDTCEQSYPHEIDSSMICAGLKQGGIDACQGDSGGPMVCETAGRFYLHGATSWGYGCAAPDKYGVYARVKYLHSWIKTQMAYN